MQTIRLQLAGKQSPAPGFKLPTSAHQLHITWQDPYCFADMQFMNQLIWTKTPINLSKLGIIRLLIDDLHVLQ